MGRQGRMEKNDDKTWGRGRCGNLDTLQINKKLTKILAKINTKNKNNYIYYTLLQSIMFSDDQILLSKSEDDLQRSVHKQQPIHTKYNMKIS